jgi:hypothetical protein
MGSRRRVHAVAMGEWRVEGVEQVEAVGPIKQV